MIITDTHTHLYSEAFDDDREEMMQRAIDAGVERFFVPAIDSSYTHSMLELKQKYPDHVFLMTGLHPTSVKPETWIDELQQLNQLVDEQEIVAIGEIGIDLYWDQSTLEIQKKAFEKQILLAKKHHLPIVIHCRDAFDEVFEVLENCADDRLYGIFHCFTGDAAQAKRALDLNFKLGIGGVVTFKNGKIDQYLKDIPLQHIVLETDSPYLAPTPYRGKRNESSYIVEVVRKLSSLYGISEEEVASITTKNSKDIFKI